MTNSADPARVRDMYVERDTLSRRVAFHAKYSVNRYGFYNWVFDQYDWPRGSRILELGCGTAVGWRGRALPEGARLTLSDFSPLMLDKARGTLAGEALLEHTRFEPIDVQAIPHGDAAFDVVIANHMLYHVPDLPRALSEIARVLAPGGRFYATTTHSRTMWQLSDIYRAFGERATFAYPEQLSFMLDNAPALLEPYFEAIETREYEDVARVTDPEGLLDYIDSYNSVPAEHWPALEALVRSKFDADGVFTIDKRTGIVIARKRP